MKRMLFVLLVTGSLLAAGGPTESRGQEKKPDPAALQKRLTELEQRIATLEKEAAALRKERSSLGAKVVVLTPQEAVEAYRKNPNQPVTVAFGVQPGSGNLRTGWRDQQDPIWATWDGLLVHKTGVAKFTAVLTPNAYMALRIPSKKKDQPAVKPPSGSERAVVGRYIDANGLQVTGLVRVRNEYGFGGAEYYIVVDDPSKVVLP